MNEPLQCGECSFCCKWMRVDDLPVTKPVGKWCEHCTPGSGCGIYESRPDSCRTFKCLWRSSQDREPDERFPLSMRPDKCKVMFYSVGETIGVRVDPGRPDALKAPDMARFVAFLKANKLKVQIGIGVTRADVEQETSEMRKPATAQLEPRIS